MISSSSVKRSNHGATIELVHLVFWFRKQNLKNWFNFLLQRIECQGKGLELGPQHVGWVELWPQPPLSSFCIYPLALHCPREADKAGHLSPGLLGWPWSGYC